MELITTKGWEYLIHIKVKVLVGLKMCVLSPFKHKPKSVKKNKKMWKFTWLVLGF